MRVGMEGCKSTSYGHSTIQGPNFCEDCHGSPPQLPLSFGAKYPQPGKSPLEDLIGPDFSSVYFKSICLNLLFSADHIKLPKQNTQNDFLHCGRKQEN